jgi:HSP20 family protein
MTNDSRTNDSSTEATKEGPISKAVTRPGILNDLREEMDRLWEAALANPWRALRASSREPVFPAIDVFQKDDVLKVHAELPGMKRENVEITIEGDALTISGEKSEASEVNEQDFYRRERSFGRFARRITLPAGAQKDKISAQFKDGVLEVEVPVQATTAQKIEIKQAD